MHSRNQLVPLVASLWGLAACQNSSNTYTNPIFDTGADPFVVKYDGMYHMLYTTATNISMLRSPSLTSWDDAEVKLAFDPPEGEDYSTNLWAPELHNIDNLWYIIFTADPNNDQPPPETDQFCDYTCPAVNHRMYVLESSSDEPWASDYIFKSQLESYDQFAIDGTYFQHDDELYHIYSCWVRGTDGWPANLCITHLSDPWTTTSNFTERQIISVPDNAWERTPYGRMQNDRLASNEGPQQLTNPATGQEFVAYSAARSDNRNYCLGLLELTEGGDPMNPSDWHKDNSGPLFYQNPREEAFGVGHASFTTSPDDTENWIVYHGMRNPWSGWSARDIRTQKFEFDQETGRPVFPRPGYGPYEGPSSGGNGSMSGGMDGEYR